MWLDVAGFRKQTLTGFGSNGSSQSNLDGTEMKVLIAGGVVTGVVWKVMGWCGVPPKNWGFSGDHEMAPCILSQNHGSGK